MQNRIREKLSESARRNLEIYLDEYQSLQPHKRLLSSLIKFEDMYQPIQKGSKYVDPFGRLASINEERKVKRAQIYLTRKDLVTTQEGKRGKHLVVTSSGKKVFFKDYPLAKLREEPWGGTWTIAMYDFPEKERAKRIALRSKLLEIGFGSPQESILVSPLPLSQAIQRLIEGEGWEENVWATRAKRVLGMENEEVTQKAWPLLPKLNLIYEELASLAPERSDKTLVREWVALFLAADAKDPYLPYELLPKNWHGKECRNILKKLTGINIFGFLFSV